MPYRPRNNELVMTTTPDRPEDPPVITLIARQATLKDKQDFILRMKNRLSEGEEIESESLKNWMVSPDIYVCIDDGHKITMVDLEYIQGPFDPESEVSLSL